MQEECLRLLWAVWRCLRGLGIRCSSLLDHLPSGLDTYMRGRCLRRTVISASALDALPHKKQETYAAYPPRMTHFVGCTLTESFMSHTLDWAHGRQHVRTPSRLDNDCDSAWKLRRVGNSMGGGKPW
jgi:hypothetical protein